MKIINILNPDFVVSSEAIGSFNFNSTEVTFTGTEKVTFEDGRLVKTIGEKTFVYNPTTRKFESQ